MSCPIRSVSRALQGLFSVYKPPGVHWKRVRDTVETNLLQEFNSLKGREARQLIRFLPVHADGEGEAETDLTVVKLPSLADHPLVKGPEFVHLKVGVGHRLDVMSSGVFVLALGHGAKQLPDLYDCHLTKEYTVKGFFGKATDDFSDTGRLIEKTTYDHITRDKLERIVAVIQGGHQKALLTYSGIDFKTQEAYELASRGLLRPMSKSPPIITGIRCVHFSPPNFTLEIRCLHETQRYLRKIVHEIGLELKSTAACSHVRRTRDGFFTLEDALIRSRWDLRNIRAAVRGRGGGGGSESRAMLLESGSELPGLPGPSGRDRPGPSETDKQ